jgi:hypothetical protein
VVVAAAVVDSVGRVAVVVVDRTDATVTEATSDGASGTDRGAPFVRERPLKPAPLGAPSSTLERAVDAAGEAWAIDWANRLHGEGRPVSGGWPGTLSEARGRVAACISRRVGAARRIGPEELEQLARRAYASARKAWLARAETTGDD